MEKIKLSVSGLVPGKRYAVKHIVGYWYCPIREDEDSGVLESCEGSSLVFSIGRGKLIVSVDAVTGISEAPDEN
jgi:hypothetical protein